MHEKRNFILVMVLIAGVVWAALAWFVFGPGTTMRLAQQIASLCVSAVCGGWLLYALSFEDKLPDHLKEQVGEIYYDADGLSFLPMVRTRGDQAELSLYYQNRYENPVHAVVHLRPPEDSFIIHPHMRDVHFAFRADGGDYGVIHQPIAVPTHLQGEVIHVELAAATYYPRSQGARLRKHAGLPCGTLLVDWEGSAFKQGVHAAAGEVELTSPVTLHLSMPAGVNSDPTTATWKQQRLAAAAAS